jgi:hypothetical protein
MKWWEVAENCIIMSFMACAYEVMENVMGRAFNLHGSEQECIQDSGGKARRKETTRKT